MVDKADSHAVSEYRQAGAIRAPLGCGVSDNLDGFSRDTDELIQRRNDWIDVVRRTDLENYVDGHFQFAFEFVERGRDGFTQLIARKLVDLPNRIVGHFAEPTIENVEGKIRDLLPDYVGRQLCVIARWNQKLVLVENVELMNQVEKLIPARF